jgi:DNA-binding transcriptional LysR family regulator
MAAFLPSTDQVITLLAVVEHGSFSAAAKVMKRTQSSVTYAIQKLEADLGLPIFDRSTRVPVLTVAGRAMVPIARRLASELETMQRTADGLASGLERKLLIAVDCVFPTAPLLRVLDRFKDLFPTVRARITVEAMHAAAESVISGESMLGIVGPVVERYPELAFTPIGSIDRVPVAAPGHPMAAWDGDIPPEAFREHVHFVMSNRSRQRRERIFNSPSSAVWRVNDMAMKHAAILAGLGWGRLPRHLAQADLDAGRLVTLRVGRLDDGNWSQPLPMHVVHRRGDTLGPATSWMLDALIDTVETVPAEEVALTAAAQ